MFIEIATTIACIPALAAATGSFSPILLATTAVAAILIPIANEGEFKNLTQQMINFIFVELWKKNTNDYRLKNEL